MPAKAGIHVFFENRNCAPLPAKSWRPAFAGKTRNSGRDR
jgi:hypothetical protein